MKNLLKRILKWLNYKSVSVFARYHFRKKAKENCKKNNLSQIDKEYQKDIKKYWKQYVKFPSTIFHRWYSGANGIKDVRYIPEDYFYDVIERYYNDMSLEPAYTDKAMFKKLYPEIKQPTTIVLNMNGLFYDENYNLITLEDAYKLVQKYNRIVIKPTRDSGGGKNVRIVEINNFDDEDCIKLFNEYNKDYIVQVPIKQHPQLAALHPESVNTIRIMSMFDNGEVTILSAIVRMGVGDSRVDNECSGGINCGIDEYGHLSSIAYDGSGKKYKRHPQGFEFNKGYIPSYERIIEIIKKQHKILPYFGLISWDFTVDENEEPIMIELNLRWCAINFHQFHHGALFGDRTDYILKNINKKY